MVLEHVVFANCKLDYALLKKVRTTGPVVFVGCPLNETQFDACSLTNVLFDGCSMQLTEFGHGVYKGCDLRGNDLSAVRGVANLNRIVIDRAQAIQLGEALIMDLGARLGDEE